MAGILYVARKLTSVLQNSLHCSGGELGPEAADADADGEPPRVTVVVAVTVTTF